MREFLYGSDLFGVGLDTVRRNNESQERKRSPFEFTLRGLEVERRVSDKVENFRGKSAKFIEILRID